MSANEILLQLTRALRMLSRAFQLTDVHDARASAEAVIDILTELVEVINDSFPKIPPGPPQDS